jgi:predicted GTPase
MNTNSFLKDIAEKRQNFKKYAQKGLENNWITQENHDQILHRIENDKLVIGVIGQMKAGKSTFLNALIFKDEVLPAATTPMTASLTVLTYGEEKSLEAEFFTTKEWDDLKYFAALNEDDYEGDTNQQSKIKAGKEIVSKSVRIENELPDLLGNKKTDDFQSLKEYVGADGKYISITKSVLIKYPLDYLKGVEIVDTPGFNDPVVSRENRTKEFLSKADVVIILLYAGRAFDSTDKDIIFNKVRSIGIGKLLIGVNKYDLNYGQGEMPSDMVSHVKEQLMKACKEHSNSSIDVLVKEQDPLLLSANMALMSQLDISRIRNNVNLKFYYDSALKNFEISSQKEMYEKSLMSAFEEAIQTIIHKSKDEILIQKPINSIKQIGENKLDEFVLKITQIKNDLVLLNKPDSELDNLLNNAKRAEKKSRKKIDSLETDILEKLKIGTDKLKNKVEDAVNKTVAECIEIIDENSFVIRTTPIYDKIKDKFGMSNYDLKREFQKINSTITSDCKQIVEEFVFDFHEISDKYLEDFDSKDCLTSFKRHFLDDIIDMTPNDLFPPNEGEDNTNAFEDILIFLGTTINFATANIIPGAINIFEAKKEARERVKRVKSSIDVNRVQKKINDNGVRLIENCKNSVLNEFVQPIIESIENLQKNKTDKEESLTRLKSDLEQAQANKNIIEFQILEMKVLEEGI